MAQRGGQEIKGGKSSAASRASWRHEDSRGFKVKGLLCLEVSLKKGKEDGETFRNLSNSTPRSASYSSRLLSSRKFAWFFSATLTASLALAHALARGERALGSNNIFSGHCVAGRKETPVLEILIFRHGLLNSKTISGVNSGTNIEKCIATCDSGEELPCAIGMRLIWGKFLSENG